MTFKETLLGLSLMLVFMGAAGESNLAFIQFLLPAISAIAGGLANRGSTQNQNSTTNTTGTTTSTPNLDANTLGFRDLILSNYIKSLATGGNFDGYRANAFSNINDLRRKQAQNLTENFASRGIQGPALNFALAGVDNQRFADLTKVNNEIPLLEQQLRSQILTNAGNFFSSIPYGTTQTQNQVTNQRGQTQTPGNVAGGIAGGLGQSLAYLLGQGAFRRPTNNNVNSTLHL